jgi:uncharacterized membrane protein YfcA
MSILSGFADISIWQLALVAGVALVASILGGVSGYGTGALMPLILVSLVGAEPVVPIIAISALFSNTSRVGAFLKYVDWRRVAIVLIGSVPTCVLGAWGYTKLTNAGAAMVIGSMLILSVPLRRLLKHHGVQVGDRGLLLGSIGYGVVVGGTAGSGVILLSMLMAAGLEGAAVIATDAAVRAGDIIRAADRHRRAARRVPGARLRRAYAGARAHRDPRRCRAGRRRVPYL